jgi:hypothetical protein
VSSVRCGVGSGSGWVAVVPVDRGDQRGSNGGKMAVAVAISAEILQLLIFFYVSFKKYYKKTTKKKPQNSHCHCQ